MPKFKYLQLYLSMNELGEKDQNLKLFEEEFK